MEAARTVRLEGPDWLMTRKSCCWEDVSNSTFRLNSDKFAAAKFRK